MARIIAFIGVLAFVTTCASAPRQKLHQNAGKGNIEVHTVESIQEFQQRHDRLKLTPLARIAVTKPKNDTSTASSDGENGGAQLQDQVRYKAGARIEGDEIILQDVISCMQIPLGTVQLDIEYPRPNKESSSEATITYVEITVDRSSDIGNAWIAEGGIGQQYIKIILQIGSTTYFNILANIYGY